MQVIVQNVLSAVIAFIVTAVVGKFLVPFLRRVKAGQSIKTDGPTWHMSKQGTPTMGGIMFIVGIAAAILLALLMGGDATACWFLHLHWCLV